MGESVFLQDLVMDSDSSTDLGHWQEITLWSAVIYGVLAAIRIIIMINPPATATASNNMLQSSIHKADNEAERASQWYIDSRFDRKSTPHKTGYQSHDERRRKRVDITGDKEEERSRRMEKEKKQVLVRESAAQFIEMAYWFIKFVGDFEKNRGGAGDSKKFHWFKKNSASIVKYARYVVKFIASYQKLIN